MSVRIIPSHDILSCLYSIMSNFSFNGLRTRISADRSCNRMFTAGISRNHNNRTSLPPSLIHSSLMLLSLRNGMSAKRISLNHDTSPYTLYCWLSGYEIHDIEIPDYAFPVFSRQQGRLPVTVHVQFHVPFQCLVTARCRPAGYVPCRSPPAVPVSGGHGTVPVPKGGPWS